MRSWRENPDSAENQRATSDNERYVGGLKLQHERSTMKAFIETHSVKLSCTRCDHVLDTITGNTFWHPTHYFDPETLDRSEIECEFAGKTFKKPILHLEEVTNLNPK